MYGVQIDLLYESALLLACVSFSLSAFVLSKGVGNRLNWSYSTLGLAISIWSFSFFLTNAIGWRLFESINLLANLFIGPLALSFLHLLLRPEGKFLNAINRISFFLLFLVSPFILLGMDHHPLIRQISYLSPSLIILTNLYLFVSEAPRASGPLGRWGDFANFYTLEMRTALKQRNAWLYLGGILVVSLGSLDHFSWMGRTVPAIGNFLICIYLYFIKDVVLLSSLLSSRRLFGRFFSHVAAAMICFVVFVTLTAWVGSNKTLLLINSFLASLVIVLSIDPIRSLSVVLFQRIFFKEATRIDLLIKRESRALVGAFHAQAIATATDSFLKDALEGKLVSFYAIDSEGKQFRKIQDGTLHQMLPETLPASFPLLNYWQRAKQWLPILQEELGREASRMMVASQQASLQLMIDSLESLQSTIAFPLTFNRAVLGFATVNLLEPPEHWEASWGPLRLLEPYFLRVGESLRELDMYARLRDRDRLATLGEMATGLAHEIRNPLGAIKGAVQVIDPRPGDPNEPFLRIIIDETNRLNGVVTQFLHYAKPFKGEYSWVDLRVQLKSICDRYRHELANNKIDFNVQFPEYMPTVFCQPDLIGRVLTNLLDNSQRALLGASMDSQARVSVRLGYNYSQEGAEISLSVEDNGPGMTPEVLDKIFIPFFTQSPQGTGLGLSICQRIAEAHGGRMEATSVPGEGTVITLRFVCQRKE